MLIDHVRTLCKHIGKGICLICETQWYPRDQNSAGRLRYQKIHGDLDPGNQIIRTGKLRHLAVTS